MPPAPASLIAALAVAGLLASPAAAQQAAVFGDAGAAREAMARARADGADAGRRAERLEAEARNVTQTVERTAREAAAVAARIQQNEARIAGLEARAALIAREQVALRTRLALRQQPLVRLTAALQRLSRRPPALALLRPGSVRDTMHTRALLETLLPQVERRTAALRVDIERAQRLERAAQRAAADLRAGERDLRTRRAGLAALESRQRIESRRAQGLADREAERALALAERAQDLGALAAELGAAGRLRETLARLPGPVLRPLRPEASQVVALAGPGEAPAGSPRFLLPVAGRLVTGFAAAAPGKPPSRGIALATRAGGQAVAPGAGRVAFAGPFRGYGSIVIIEHGGGWASLLTGLAELDVKVGDPVIAGSPVGRSGAGAPLVGFELRRDGEPVNPLAFIATP